MWKPFLILSLSIPFLGGVASCSHNQQIPRWEGEIWAGKPSLGAIVRAQANDVILATDPQFKDFMAMRWKGPNGFEGFYETYVLGCKEWKQGVPKMTLREAQLMLLDAQEIGEVDALDRDRE